MNILHNRQIVFIYVCVQLCTHTYAYMGVHVCAFSRACVHLFAHACGRAYTRLRSYRKHHLSRCRQQFRRWHTLGKNTYESRSFKEKVWKPWKQLTEIWIWWQPESEYLIFAGRETQTRKESISILNTSKAFLLRIHCQRQKKKLGHLTSHLTA